MNAVPFISCSKSSLPKATMKNAKTVVMSWLLMGQCFHPCGAMWIMFSGVQRIFWGTWGGKLWRGCPAGSWVQCLPQYKSSIIWIWFWSFSVWPLCFLSALTGVYKADKMSYKECWLYRSCVQDAWFFLILTHNFLIEWKYCKSDNLVWYISDYFRTTKFTLIF